MSVDFYIFESLKGRVSSLYAIAFFSVAQYTVTEKYIVVDLNTILASCKVNFKSKMELP